MFVTKSTLTQDETAQHSLLVALQQLRKKDKAIADLEEELAALKKQMIALRDLYEQQKRFNIEHKNQGSEEKLKTENALLQSSLTDISQHNKQLERVVQFLRERAEESHLEAKQLREEFQANRELVETLTSQSEAHDQELKMAQQHLGKKMREAAELSDKNENLTQQIQQLQKELTESQNFAIASQQKLNILQMREKNFQDQLLHREQDMEQLNKSWEEKYSQLHEKWQASESDFKHFKSLEEKYFQIQNAITNLNALFGSLQSKSSFDDQRHSIKLVEAIQANTENNVTPIRYKQTLFD